MWDRNNPTRIPDNTPAGLSQLSFVPDQNDDKSNTNVWSHLMEELSNTEDYQDSGLNREKKP
jgi:hypothetical protein